MMSLAVALALGSVIGAMAQAPAELEIFERPGSSLGPEIGASGTSALEPSGGQVGGRPGSAVGRIPYNVAQPGGWQRLSQAQVEIVPAPTMRAAEAPAYGSLEIPTRTDDEGPEHGLTLDQAIETLVRENLDLRAKALELPQADADILTASLRANPLFFADTQLVPYGSFDPVERPGGQTQYDVNVSLPLDVTHKRRARTVVAVQAKRVLHAQYQDAVRLAIDNLYTAYVDVLAARETVRFAQASVAGLDKLLQATQAQEKQTIKSRTEVNQMLIQRDAASLGLLEAEAALRHAKHHLALQLNLSPLDAEHLEVRGILHQQSPNTPPLEELTAMANAVRPDLTAYRLGLSRAAADTQLARASRMQDVYVMYQPVTVQDNRQYGNGVPNVTSWAAGVTMNVPLFDRNQGNIRRAQINQTQTLLELRSLERQVAHDIERAYHQLQITQATIERLEKTLLPAARQVLNANLQLYQQGEASMFNYLAAQREHNELVRQYRDSLVAHRRAMLALNTVVGQRVLP